MICLESRRPPFGGPRYACVGDVRCGVERETGIEPATSCLEGTTSLPRARLIADPSDSKIGVEMGPRQNRPMGSKERIRFNRYRSLLATSGRRPARSNPPPSTTLAPQPRGYDFCPLRLHTHLRHPPEFSGLLRWTPLGIVLDGNILLTRVGLLAPLA